MLHQSFLDSYWQVNDGDCDSLLAKIKAKTLQGGEIMNNLTDGLEGSIGDMIASEWRLFAEIVASCLRVNVKTEMFQWGQRAQVLPNVLDCFISDLLRPVKCEYFEFY